MQFDGGSVLLLLFFFLRFRIDPMIDGGGGIDGDADLVFSLSLSILVSYS